MNSNDLAKLPAINAADGERVGEVERALLDPRRRQIVGFAIRTGGGVFAPESGLLADTAEVRALGSGALTLATPTPRGTVTGERYGDLIDLGTLHGREVYSEAGALLGHVASTTIAEADLALAGIAVATGLLHGKREIPIERVVTIGPDVIVVTPEPGPAVAEARAPAVQPA